MVLLIGAALLLESYVRMYRRDLGYRPEGAQAMLLLGIKQQPAAEIVRRVAALPGVEAAGTVGPLPGWPVVWPFAFRRIEIEAAAEESSLAHCITLSATGTSTPWGSLCCADAVSRRRRTCKSAT